ncbi:NAD(P)/FAD-dependent oxidoreductase [Alkalimonas collagenimarina]|uniref:NAD(P)/FAD-dependent oxidoreductase n=1 Tax=Alkalimonas collagenimarina TaxID=400390 RepID=A0ABT9GUQ2_9GAMM|nr:NAD(P)/FAD-dependent oxidoreductase [Alkalimonas collagenimarina]MDP4534779.1 NAD(P)/FAD-dependent oxidoreductase [Alkalimonas collagenimarina]
MQNILIVGGGAGGLELATRLGKKLGKASKARITLVDKNTSHIWKPLLHEVASGSLDTDTDGVIYSAHAARHGYQFQHGEFIGLNTAEKNLTLAAIYTDEGDLLVPERTLHYDTLVLAIGSVSNDFGTPGVSKHCYFLDSAPQALRFHRALMNNFVRINQQDDDRALNIAIVGGGATGVELAAELYHVAALAKRYGLSAMNAKKLKIHLLEAGPSILPALPSRIADAVRKELSLLGVEVRENTKVSAANAQGFITADDQQIIAGMMVWAAGVKVPNFIAKLAIFELNRLQQILVTPELKAKGFDDIYVLGDCCGFQQQDGSWVPPRAQSAHQMASLVADNILRQRRQKPLKPFVYKDHGSLVNLSRYSTVGSLMGNLTGNSMFIEGKLARFVYISLYRMHQIAIHGWWKGMLLVLVEKMNRAVRPKLKLH